MARRDYFTCYLVERDGVFEGLCVDLDIAVQGGSAEDTRTKLGRAIETYIVDVMAEAPEDRPHLLNRRTPWPIRWSFAARIAVDGLMRRGHDARFRVPCPV